MDTAGRNPIRILAPAAIVVFGLALIIVLASSGGSSNGGTTNPSAQKAQDLGSTTAQSTKPRRKHSSNLPDETYVVKAGDTFGSISQKTGIPIGKLQELNPTIDPQGLVSGQRIKLR